MIPINPAMRAQQLAYEISKQHDHHRGEPPTSLEQACELVRRYIPHIDNASHAWVSTELYLVHGVITQEDLQHHLRDRPTLYTIPFTEVDGSEGHFLAWLTLADVARLGNVTMWEARISTLDEVLRDLPKQ